MEELFRARVRAPEFVGISAWINSKPLGMGKLKGKVVLVDFWTYTCINCIRTLPYVERWHEKYAERGLVVVGVATPEFLFEANAKNVREAVKRFGLKYPIAVDPKMKTWSAFDNHYWPAKFIIDKDGFVSYVHFGEGNYSQTEMAIQMALGIKGKPEKEEFSAYMFDQSPETYAGFAKNNGLGSGLVCDDKGCNVYIDPGHHAPNTLYPNGLWVQEKEYLELKKAPGLLSYRFNAREVNIVMEPAGKSSKAEVFVDGLKVADALVKEPRMYNVFSDKKYRERELQIVFRGKVRVYALTFG